MLVINNSVNPIDDGYCHRGPAQTVIVLLYDVRQHLINDNCRRKCLLSFHFILLKAIHSQQSQTVTIHTELDSEATEHRQRLMS